jgi:hypothetical protein
MRYLYLAFIALVVALCTMMAIRAEAHAWYEYSCCSGMDCKPLAYFEVRAQPGGYTVTPWGGPPTFVPNGDKRIREIPPEAPAEDAQRFHACTVGGKPDGRLLCLYVPQGGA